MTCCQWATVRFRHLCAHSKRRRRWLEVGRGFVVGLYAQLPRDKSRLLTVVWPALIPYRFLIRAVKAQALKKRSCRTILSNARPCRGVVFRGVPEDLPGTKDPVAACLLSMRLTVARVKPTQAAIAPCLMPSWASANTSCLTPIGVGRGIVRTIRKERSLMVFLPGLCDTWLSTIIGERSFDYTNSSCLRNSIRMNHAFM